MNWIDNVIGYISPSWGSRRAARRQDLDQGKSYDAGGYGRHNANWHVSNESGEITNRYSRDNVRARARDLERNSDMMGAVIGAYKRNVIGGGYTLQAKSNDEKVNTELERLWKKWCKKINCDVTGTQSFNQIIRMAVGRKKIDGGILFLKRYTNYGMIPFQLQVLEVDELDANQTIPKNEKNKVIGGVEVNSYNKIQGYWIKRYSLDNYYIEDPVYIKESDIIYYYSKSRPSQVREMSDMSPTIMRIRDTNEFMTAVSVKERILSCLSVFIKKVTPGGDIGRNFSSEQTKGMDYSGKTLTPGMIGYLNPGDEIQTVNPSGQATDATSYIKLQQRAIGAGQGISYESVSRDMSETNYSSARQGNIEDELTYADERELLIEVMGEIYVTFVISCILSNAIKIPKFWENKEEYLQHIWIQAPKKWIDPVKEANSNKIALQTGQKTFAQICAENGKDWKEQLEEMHEIQKAAEELELDMDKIIYGQVTKAIKGGEESGKTGEKKQRQ